MKTNSTAVQATAPITQINQSAIQAPINPVLVECLCQLQEISRRIFELCDNDPLKDCRAGYLPDFEDHINETANSISEMARVDFLDNLFFSDSKGKEACDA